MKRCYQCMEMIPDDADTCPKCGKDPSGGDLDPSALKPGTVLKERYEIGMPLGHGSCGISYLARDLQNDTRIVVKEYFPAQYATRGTENSRLMLMRKEDTRAYEHGLSTFMSEAKRLEQIGAHPHIVSVFDSFQDNNTGYMIMEYLSGKSLADILKKRKQLPYQKTRVIILAVLDALCAVHNAGLIHRDVNPGNIFIVSGGNVKLLDFAYARSSVSVVSKSLSVMLKIGYSPVEQYVTHSKLGPWTDIYALGATYYMMITGELPEESLSRRTQDTLKKPSELGIYIPADDEAALMKALAVKPEDRFQSAEEFRHVLIESRRKEREAGNGSRIQAVKPSAASENPAPQNAPHPRNSANKLPHSIQRSNPQIPKSFTVPTSVPKSERAKSARPIPSEWPDPSRLNTESRREKADENPKPTESATRKSRTRKKENPLPFILVAGGLVLLCVALIIGIVFVFRSVKNKQPTIETETITVTATPTPTPAPEKAEAEATPTPAPETDTTVPATVPETVTDTPAETETVSGAPASTESGLSVTPSDGQYMVLEELNVRSDANKDSDWIGTLNEGDMIHVTGIVDNWVQFEWNGSYAYCSASYIEQQ